MARTNGNATKSSKNGSKAAGKQSTDVIFVLDQSSSMMSCRQQAMDNFNEQVDSIRTNASNPGVGDVFVTLIVFADTSTVVFKRIPLDQLRKLTDRDYHPNGNTAWLNAVHLGITEMKALADYNEPTHSYLMVSVTDGAENMSQAHEPYATWETIAALTKECQDTGRWTFSVMGANIDLSDVTARMGIPVANSIAYSSTPVGTQSVTSTARRASQNFFAARARGVTASSSYMDDVTGGARHADDDPNNAGAVAPGGTPSYPYQPTIPPQPVNRRPQNARRRGSNEGSVSGGGAISGAKSPLLGQK